MSDELDLTLRLFETRATEDQLLIGLGANLDMGFDDSSPSEKLKAGANWWHAHSSNVKAIVCEFLGKNDAATAIGTEIVQIVFTAIGAKYGAGIASYVAVLAIRKATAGWCGEPGSAP